MPISNRIRDVYRKLTFRNAISRKSALTFDAAWKLLQDFYPRGVPNFIQHNSHEPVYDLMVIVPVYNVEAYLESCVTSVLNQKTHYTYQTVFVDDGSTDSSGIILDRMVSAPHIVIHQDNHGVSAERNLALHSLSGRYVMFVDSDDYLAPDAVEKLVAAADQYQADIAECGYADFNEEGIFARTAHGTETRMISNRELYGFPWGKVIRYELLREFCFPVGYWYEDTVMATLLHPQSSRSVGIPDILYYYRDNPSGYTRTSKQKRNSVDTFWMMYYYLEERIRRGQVLEQADYRKYLIAVQRNWIRMEGLPEEIQESVFVLTCDLFAKVLPFRYDGGEKRMVLLEQTIRKRSYNAYRFLMERWDVM